MRSSRESVDTGAPGGDAASEEARLLEGLRANDASAREALVARYGQLVEGVVASVLGVDGELADIVQDALIQVLTSAKKVRDPGSLKAWIARVSVFTAQSALRRRRRRRWLRFVAPEDLPDLGAPAPQPAQESLRATYRVLDRMPVDERAAFALRFIAELELTETAEACGISLATVKRRLRRAEERFLMLAADEPALASRLAARQEAP